MKHKLFLGTLFFLTTNALAACLPPTDVQFMISSTKKDLTLAWMPPNGGDQVLYYQINNWQNVPMHKGKSPTERFYQDHSLPGTSGTFTYYLYSVCTSGYSNALKFDATFIK